MYPSLETAAAACQLGAEHRAVDLPPSTSIAAGPTRAGEADSAATPESARLAACAAEEISPRSGDGWGRGSSSSASRRDLSGCAGEATAAATLSRFVPGWCARMACAQRAAAWDQAAGGGLGPGCRLRASRQRWLVGGWWLGRTVSRVPQRADPVGWSPTGTGGSLEARQSYLPAPHTGCASATPAAELRRIIRHAHRPALSRRCMLRA